MQLFEQYRPTSWKEVCGQDKAIAKLNLIRQRDGLAGRAYWISGQSGTGKTTIGKLIAAEIASEFCTLELDASEVTPAMLKQLERELSTRGLVAPGGRAVLLNEAHAARKDAIRQLLVMLERIPAHVVWVFTTTSDNMDQLFEDNLDAHPLLSRCIELPLSRRGLAEPFAQRVREIAIAEGLDGQPLEAYIKLAKECKNNCRKMLSRVEGGCMVGNGDA
jgi:replication-associated recombination protein RarA